MNARSSKLRVLVLRDPGFRLDDDGAVGEVAAALMDQPTIKVTESPAGYGEAVRSVQRSEADLVIIDEVAGDPSAVVEQIDNVAPEMPIIVALGEDQKAMAQACILAGARAYLYRPFDPNELLEIVQRIHSKEDRRRKQRGSGGPAQSGRLVVVHGAKGGVGATMVGVNLAVALRQTTGQRVALVDVNLMGGDVAVALNITSDNSIADLVAHIRELDGEMLHDTMVEHPSGISVLPSPAQLERAEAITGDETASILAACRTHFDWVVADTASRLDEHVLAALDLADVILLICTPEIASLKNTARFLRLGHELGYGTDKMRLLINRLQSNGAISLADIEESLRHKMSFGLPSDGVPIVQSLNAGEPVMTLKPRSRAAAELRRLATALAEQVGAPIGAASAARPDDDEETAKKPKLAFLGRLRPLRLGGAR